MVVNIAQAVKEENDMDIRKTVTFVEEINSEYGAPANPPLRRVAIAAVFRNPLAGKPAGADIQPLILFARTRRFAHQDGDGHPRR
jgi:hypothetical protein